MMWICAIEYYRAYFFGALVTGFEEYIIYIEPSYQLVKPLIPFPDLFHQPVYLPSNLPLGISHFKSWKVHQQEIMAGQLGPSPATYPP